MADDRIGFDITASAQVPAGEPGEMPADILAGCTVSDPSEDVESYYGRAGGTFDGESGVLELVYEPYSRAEEGLGENDPLPEWADDRFAPTRVRFVEVEKLLEVLAGLKWPRTDVASEGEWWRAVLAEKLDAHAL